MGGQSGSRGESCGGGFVCMSVTERENARCSHICMLQQFPHSSAAGMTDLWDVGLQCTCTSGNEHLYTVTLTSYVMHTA